MSSFNQAAKDVPSRNSINENIADLESQIIQGIELGEEIGLLFFFEDVIDTLYNDLKTYYPSSIM